MAKENRKPRKKKTETEAEAEHVKNSWGSRARHLFMGFVRFIWAWSWLFSIVFSVVLALMLATYSPEDPAFSVSTTSSPDNLFGRTGAVTADLMLAGFGLSAWWFVLGSAMIGVFAIRAMIRRHNGETDPLRINPPKLSAAVGFLALLIGSTCLEALRLRRFRTILPGEPGGIVGEWFGDGISHYIGLGVTTVLCFALMALGLSLLMDFEWESIAEKIGSFIDRFIIRPVAGLLYRKPRTEPAVPESPAEVPTPAVETARPFFVKKAAAAPAAEQPSERAEPVFAPEVNMPEPAASSALPSRAAAQTPRVQQAALQVKPAAGQAQTALSLTLLDDPDENAATNSEETLAMTSRLIVSKLKSYNIEASVTGAQTGPVITQYWLEPGPGVKGAQIDNVHDDLRRALGVQAVRVVPSIPGTSYIGLEVPNTVRENVRLKEILGSHVFAESKAPLTLALGKDIAGRPFVIDLAKMPHLLVAGTTGSGKSVGINAMILSMLYRNTPDELRLVLVDPKMLEFSLYNGIPHLLCPVVTDMNKAATALKWLTREMDRRYEVMSRVGVRHFNTYNEKVRAAAAAGQPMLDPTAAPDDPVKEELQPWPFLVCIIDELADLMLTNRKEVEGEITRLTQKARAAGIHLIIATQRPSVDVVTSLIKANVPTRISFQVASAIDSRVILGETGAESLLGWGDMLLRRPGVSQSTRIQGCFVADDEVLRVVEELKRQGSPSYVDGVTEDEEEDDDEEFGSGRSGRSDELYDRAVDIVLRERRVSISRLQRALGVGYNRAANLVEAMERDEVVSKPSGSTAKRTVLVPPRE